MSIQSHLLEGANMRFIGVNYNLVGSIVGRYRIAIGIIFKEIKYF